MGVISKISWTDGTINFWEGCEKISEGCKFCYAKDRDDRWNGGAHWGPNAPRKKGVHAIKNLLKMNEQASAGKFIRCHCGIRRWSNDKCCGYSGPVDLVRPTIFTLSLGDFADEKVPDEWRAEALATILECHSLDFMILTKRPEALKPLLAKATLKMTKGKASQVLAWLDGIDIPQNIAIGATIESDKTASDRLRHLAEFPAARRFISAEPLLSENWGWQLSHFKIGTFHLLIAGGESGTQARPMHPSWMLDLEKACDENLIPFHMKQWGEWVPMEFTETTWWNIPTKGNMIALRKDGSFTEYDPFYRYGSDVAVMKRVGKKASGWSCDATGRTRTERLSFPTQPWKERWWYIDVKDPEGSLRTVRRYFNGPAAGPEWIAAHPDRMPLIERIKPLTGTPKF